jgi:hypothetical protein
MDFICLKEFEHKDVQVPKTSKSMKKGENVKSLLPNLFLGSFLFLLLHRLARRNPLCGSQFWQDCLL